MHLATVCGSLPQCTCSSLQAYVRQRMLHMLFLVLPCGGMRLRGPEPTPPCHLIAGPSGVAGKGPLESNLLTVPVASAAGPGPVQWQALQWLTFAPCLPFTLLPDADEAGKGAEPRPIAGTDMRCRGVSWGTSDFALLYEAEWKSRRSVTWWVWCCAAQACLDWWRSVCLSLQGTGAATLRSLVDLVAFRARCLRCRRRCS